MDLDAAPEAHRSLKEAIQAFLGSRDLVQRLRELGMTGVAYSGRPSAPEIGQLEFAGQVLEFIREEDRRRLDDAWTEIQLFVADLIEAVCVLTPKERTGEEDHRGGMEDPPP